MTDTALLRIQNPRAFLMPDLNAFVLRALSSSTIIKAPAAALLELVDYVEHPGAGVYVVREGSEYVGLLLIEHSGSAFTPGCTVLHMHNAGSTEARKKLVDAAVAFARDHGASQLWGVDTNSKPGAFARLFKAAGPAVNRGCLFEFDTSEGDL